MTEWRRGPAERSQQESGDVVNELRFTNYDLRITNTNEFIDFINAHRQEDYSHYQAGGRSEEIAVTPRLEAETPEGEGALGWQSPNIQFIHYPWWQMPFRASVTGSKEAVGVETCRRVRENGFRSGNPRQSPE